MGFNIETSVPMLTVFIQGLLSFFSPCVLPLVPLYVGYLAGGARTVDENGVIHYPRGKVLGNTIFFVIGVSFAFFLLGFGFTALGRFFSDNRIWFARISGIIMILFGLYQLGVFGKSGAMEREHRLPFRLDRFAMGPVPAFLLGFTFSFAWTPCIGPTLGSVLLMAGSTGTSAQAFLLIGVYTLGFVLPFLAVGLFTGTVLGFFKKHANVVRYTVKAAAILLILMGIMTLTGIMNNMTSFLSAPAPAAQSAAVSEAAPAPAAEAPAPAPEAAAPAPEAPAPAESAAPAATEAPEVREIVAPDFTFTDQYGEEHTLSDYKGKTVFLNFWATWCPPCRQEMPEIEALYERYGKNEGDVVVLGVAAPGFSGEGTVEEISAFLEDQGYTFPVVMDVTGTAFANYGISSFPTTYMIHSSGNVYGYVSGALSGDVMESIVQQTINS